MDPGRPHDGTARSGDLTVGVDHQNGILAEQADQRGRVARIDRGPERRHQSAMRFGGWAGLARRLGSDPSARPSQQLARPCLAGTEDCSDLGLGEADAIDGRWLSASASRLVVGS
jgi:hypothetical protein